jgi:FMN phosphatase YigB (HAD superfamily)
VAERWATFDCYGTLVDWNLGVGDELARIFGAGARDRLLRAITSSSRWWRQRLPSAPTGR